MMRVPDVRWTGRASLRPQIAQARCQVPARPRGHALSGGLLGFDSEGRGGAWYSGCSQPPAEIVYPVGRGRVSVRDVQTRLNESERGRSR
jgi:hypothetical protein